MEQLRRLLRPVGEGWRPRHQDSLIVHLQELVTVHVEWKAELWAFGNREYVNNTDGEVAYRAVGVQVFQCPFFVFVEVGDMDMETVESLVKQLKVTRWEVVCQRRGVGWDYQRQRTYLKLYLQGPVGLVGLRKTLGAPLQDHRGRSHELNLYHDDFGWDDHFLHATGVKLQSWVVFDQVKPAEKPRSGCQEEYTLHFHPSHIRPLLDAPTTSPFLCATLRTRLDKSQEDNPVVALCSDLYWSGHDSEVVEVRLFTDDVLLPISQHTRLYKCFACPDELMRVWRALIRELDVDVVAFMPDMGNDMVQVLEHIPDHNLSRLPKHSMRWRPWGNRWFYDLPGRVEFNLATYMGKMQVSPRFDEFTLNAACQHKAMYRGERVDLDTRPAHVTAQFPLAVVGPQCAEEAGLLRQVLDTSAVLVGAAAISRTTGLPLTITISGGQQKRVYQRLKSDFCRQGRIINMEQLRRPTPVRSSRLYNSFPYPIKLPNIMIRDRKSNYREEILRVYRKAQPAPDQPWVKTPAAVMELAHSTVVPGPSQKEEEEEEEEVNDKRKGFTDLFGHPIQKRQRQMVVAKKVKPKRHKYEGGLVLPPHPGYYADVGTKKNYCAVLDFASLYPSIMMGYLLCYCNLVVNEADFDDPELELLWVEIDEVLHESVAFVMKYKGNPVVTVLPETQRVLVNERTTVKRLMTQAKQQLKSLPVQLPDTDFKTVRAYVAAHPEQRQAVAEFVRLAQLITNLNAEQLGKKIIQNSVYGFLGVRRNGIMPWHEIMAAVTRIGRWMNLSSQFILILLWCVAIIYGDTDSVIIGAPGMVQREDEDDEAHRKRCWADYAGMGKVLSALFMAPNEMEMECLIQRFLLSEKKNYGMLIYEDPTDSPKMKVVGYPVTKRDRCLWVRQIGSWLLDVLLQHPEKIPEIPRYLTQQLHRLGSGQVQWKELQVSSVVKAREDYKTKNPDHLIQVRVAEQIASTTGLPLVPGSRLRYVVVQGAAPQYMRGSTVEEAERQGKQADLNHYLQQLKPNLVKMLRFHSQGLRLQRLISDTERKISRFYSTKDRNGLLQMLSTQAHPTTPDQ